MQTTIDKNQLKEFLRMLQKRLEITVAADNSGFRELVIDCIRAIKEFKELHDLK